MIHRDQNGEELRLPTGDWDRGAVTPVILQDSDESVHLAQTSGGMIKITDPTEAINIGKYLVQWGINHGGRRER